MNPDKIFLIRKGEIENRIDAQYYAENLNVTGFIKLGSLVRVKGGKRIPKGFSYSDGETGYWYLRVDDIDPFGDIKFSRIKYISEEIFEELESYELKPKEVVISIAGTIGKITLLESEPRKRIILTENCAKLQIKKAGLLPKFLRVILSLPFVQKQMSLSYVQTTIPKLGLERINNLKIPSVPPIEIQQRIIDKFEIALASKRGKEVEAMELLNHVDTYLLKSLGVVPPAESETKKSFFVRYSQISGRRLDASAYKTSFNYTSSRYPIEQLSKIAFIDPKVSFAKLDKESEISFIPMEVIDERNGTIVDIRTKKVGDSKGFTRFQENDLIWAKITPCMQNGKSAIARDLRQGFGFGSTEFYVIRPKSTNVLVDYLFILLRNKRVLENAQNFFGGSAGQQRVSVEFLQNFQIPLPPLEVQKEFVGQVKFMRERAKELEYEAKSEYERATVEIEKIILGEL